MPLEMKTKPVTKFRVRCDMGKRLRAAFPGNCGEVKPCMNRGPWRRQPWRARLDAEKRGFLQVEPGVMVCPDHGGRVPTEPWSS